MADEETTVQECARSANEIGAEDIVVIDLRGISSIADYFVICTGTSMPHLKAIQRDIEKGVEAAISEIPIRKDGKADSMWVVLDYADVLVHIFHKEMRDVYNLENLWSDAPRVTYDFIDESKKAAAAPIADLADEMESEDV
ncbi:ribosome silencing factor [bacterium]|nr:ribosome silencing factor [bacterium]